MKLILENIGMLNHAELTLHPLSVIAGENDNGKSTIGKIVFCIVKAINRYKEDLQESKDHQIQEKINDLYFLFRRNLSNVDSSVENLLIRFRNLKMRNDLDLSDIPQEVKKILEEIWGNNSFGNSDRAQEFKKSSLFIYNEIENLALKPTNERESIEIAFRKVFASEFESSLLFQGEDEGRIRLVENEIDIINLIISNNSGAILKSDIDEPLEFKDATFIESPLVLNHHDLLMRSQTLFDSKKRQIGPIGIPYTSLHNKDLFEKLREPQVTEYDLLTDRENFELLVKLKGIINGEIAYDKKGSRDFVFRRNQEAISIKNTASGIKVFGLLKILLENEMISKNTILIFDEPENHLHPKWQLKLAELLVNMVQLGIYVLVSSHSPYMIEALKRYSERLVNGKSSGFFLAENHRIEDKDRLGEIFEILAEPFEIFRKMDAKELQGGDK